MRLQRASCDDSNGTVETPRVPVRDISAPQAYREWMTARLAAAIACVAVAMAVAALVTNSALADTAKQGRGLPRGAVESCARQSGATFPGAFTSRRNLVVGPLALIGAGGTPRFVWDSTGNEGFQKFPLLVRSGHRVTVELSPRTRRGAGLAYGPLPQGETHLRDTHRVVTFIACRGAEPSASRADRRPVTFWSGGVLARSPRCMPLLVWIDDAASPRRAVIRLGVRDCG